MFDIIQKPKRWINLKKPVLFKSSSSEDCENVMILEEPSKKVCFQKSLLQPISIKIKKFAAAAEEEEKKREERNNLLQQQQHDELKCSSFVILLIEIIVICMHLGLIIFFSLPYIHTIINNNTTNYNKNE